MDLTARKLEIIQKLMGINSLELLSQIEKLITKNPNKSDVFEPMTIDDLNSRIERSLKDSKAGKIVSTHDLLKRVENWE